MSGTRILPWAAFRRFPAIHLVVYALFSGHIALGQTTIQDTPSVPPQPLARAYLPPAELQPLSSAPALFRRAPARTGLRDPIVYTMAWQIVGIGLLLSMDREATGFLPASPRNVIKGMTSAPVWDPDNWYTNYVGHPIWGSESYLVVRRSGYSRAESFLFSTASSVVWEYGVESWVEHPSIQDLLATSTLGSVLGEVRYRAVRSLAKSEAWWARPLLYTVDPFRSVYRLTGLRIKMDVRPL